MRKKFLIVFLMGFILFSLAGTVSAVDSVDLGITDAGVLPTSRFYFLKEWGRGLERIFTFNSIKKAELELKIANEKAAEALEVEKLKPADSQAITKAVENYVSVHENLKLRFESLKESSENPNVEKLLNKFDDLIEKHKTLFKEIEEKHDAEEFKEEFDILDQSFDDFDDLDDIDIEDLDELEDVEDIDDLSDLEDLDDLDDIEKIDELDNDSNQSRGDDRINCGALPQIPAPPIGCRYDGPKCIESKWQVKLVCTERPSGDSE